MNISYNWLKRYIDTDLPGRKDRTDADRHRTRSRRFRRSKPSKGGFTALSSASVVTCRSPDSDHLHVTAVDVEPPSPCRSSAAPANCRAGLKVLCATVGVVLPDGGDEFKIKRSKIRGVESLGMLCAEDELGIGSSHDGIMELPADAPSA